LSYGERLRAAGRDDDARVQLRLAAATFRHLCSMPWLGRATNQLRALGDIRDRMPTGAPLAAMERRVTDLAASGLTNREIAGQLRIPASTVSGQLSRVYAKLGVGSRAALGDALPPPPDRR
jgi:DNA-binding CsgD family transcriptional regulator